MCIMGPPKKLSGAWESPGNVFLFEEMTEAFEWP